MISDVGQPARPAVSLPRLPYIASLVLVFSVLSALHLMRTAPEDDFRAAHSVSSQPVLWSSIAQTIDLPVLKLVPASEARAADSIGASVALKGLDPKARLRSFLSENGMFLGVNDDAEDPHIIAQGSGAIMTSPQNGEQWFIARQSAFDIATLLALNNLVSHLSHDVTEHPGRSENGICNAINNLFRGETAILECLEKNALSVSPDKSRTSLGGTVPIFLAQGPVSAKSSNHVVAVALDWSSRSESLALQIIAGEHPPISDRAVANLRETLQQTLYSAKSMPPIAERVRLVKDDIGERRLVVSIPLLQDTLVKYGDALPKILAQARLIEFLGPHTLVHSENQMLDRDVPAPMDDDRYSDRGGQESPQHSSCPRQDAIVQDHRGIQTCLEYADEPGGFDEPGNAKALRITWIRRIVLSGNISGAATRGGSDTISVSSRFEIKNGRQSKTIESSSSIQAPGYGRLRKLSVQSITEPTTGLQVAITNYVWSPG